eukprot:4673225-Pyramimonas_sp.AAC.1
MTDVDFENISGGFETPLSLSEDFAFFVLLRCGGPSLVSHNWLAHHSVFADPFADAEAESESQNYIHVRVQQRNGRKSLTTVQVRRSWFFLDVSNPRTFAHELASCAQDTFHSVVLIARRLVVASNLLLRTLTNEGGQTVTCHLRACLHAVFPYANDSNVGKILALDADPVTCRYV